jgi:ABC-2 type transport system ATP-binding protein
MTDAIKIRNLGYRAGKEFAIRDLAMTVPEGAVYGFLGPNGSGKTTTIRLMLGMLPKDDGEITVLGNAIPDSAHKALGQIGYVPERLHLYQTLTVEESISYHAAFYPRWDRAEAERLRKQFQLRESTLVGRLSKGEAGKLMTLLALASRPDLLVLDEPTDGLDPVVRRDVLSALVEFVERKGATVFISSHLVHEQERICDWVGVMDGGRLVAELPMNTFRAGIKRLRVAGRMTLPEGAPFVVLARDQVGAREEHWVVRGWQPEMTGWFDGNATELRDVMDLDLEESFVELLRTSRGTAEGV